MTIDEMQAGPEMNALVAEKVMGWTRCSNEDCQGCDHPIYLTGGRWIVRVPGRDWDDDDYIFAPSTGISAAWMVVEKMREMGFMFRLQSFDTVGAEFQQPWGFFVSSSATTAPPAICKAALKAVEAR